MSYQNLPSLLLKLPIILLFFCFFLSHSTSVKAEEKEVDINTNPNGYFFDVSELKPGDWMPRDIVIKNEGVQNFKYTAVIGKKKSKKGLLEELELLVKKDSDVLYEGKLTEFEGFSPRNLAAGTSETMLFQVTMPYHLGNEFQESSAEVEILFIAEAVGTPVEENPSEGSVTPGGSSSSGDNNKDAITVTPEMRENILPNTASNFYNFIFIGIFVLGAGGILFFLQKRRLRRDLK